LNYYDFLTQVIIISVVSLFSVISILPVVFSCIITAIFDHAADITAIGLIVGIAAAVAEVDMPRRVRGRGVGRGKPIVTARGILKH
jgi:hypothetical protein